VTVKEMTMTPVEAKYPQSRVLITGGAGFIGSSVADALLERGDHVVIIDDVNDYYNPVLKERNIKRLQDKYSNESLEVVIGDICDEKLVNEVFSSGIDAVCHLAARAGVRVSIEDPLSYVEVNIKGTVILLEAARKHKAGNFVFASSSSVYGESSSKSGFKENDSGTDKPISPYAATKKACENLGYVYSQLYGLPVTGLRFFTVYGPRGRPDMAIFKFIDRIYHDKAIDQYGSGDSQRDYTYIDDIVSGVLVALDTPRSFEIFNLGNNNPVHLTELIGIIEEKLEKTAVRNVIDTQLGDTSFTCADISKAKEMLGYSPSVSLKQGIELTVEWYLNEYLPLINEESSSKKEEEEQFVQQDC